MNGTYSQKNILRTFPTDLTLSWWEALLLFGSGILAVVLHRAFDLSLGLPGHHGIEWMALLILGRASSRFRGAGTITSLGASLASMVPFLQGGNPFGWFFYLLPGLVVDAAFRYLPRVANQPGFLVLLAGLAHLTKPIAQWVLHLIIGWPFGSFRFGILYPFVGHLLFGMIGGLFGAWIVLGIRRYSQKSPR
jgi:hypothetical protein